MNAPNSDDLKFLCEVCGKQFDPDPGSMVEVLMHGECPCCEGGLSRQEAEKLTESGEAIAADQLAAMNEEELREIGLTPEERDRLLAGEDIAIGGACICRECQDRLAAEQGH